MEFKGTKWTAKHESVEFCDTGDYEYHATIVDENGKCIAQFFNKDEELREKECNLAAAAPELLEALQDLVYTAQKLFEEVSPIKSGGGINVIHPIIENAKSVLTKALGE